MANYFPELVGGRFYVIQTKKNTDILRFLHETTTSLVFETSEGKPRLIMFHDKVIDPNTESAMQPSSEALYPDYRNLLYSLYGNVEDLLIFGPNYEVIHSIGEPEDTQLRIERDLEFHPTGYVITVISPEGQTTRKPITVPEFKQLTATLHLTENQHNQEETNND